MIPLVLKYNINSSVIRYMKSYVTLRDMSDIFWTSFNIFGSHEIIFFAKDCLSSRSISFCKSLLISGPTMHCLKIIIIIIEYDQFCKKYRRSAANSIFWFTFVRILRISRFTMNHRAKSILKTILNTIFC